MPKQRTNRAASGTPELANIIRDHRARHKLTEKELAKRLGVSRAFISNVSLGTHPITNEETVNAVARETGKRPYDIYAASKYVPHDLYRAISNMTADQMIELREAMKAVGLYHENP